jgi:hypothetical protein
MCRPILQPIKWQIVADIFLDCLILKMGTLRPFQTVAAIYLSTRRNIAEDLILNRYRRRTSNLVPHPHHILAEQTGAFVSRKGDMDARCHSHKDFVYE